MSGEERQIEIRFSGLKFNQRKLSSRSILISNLDFIRFKEISNLEFD
jgi:hypothetical protein